MRSPLLHHACASHLVHALDFSLNVAHQPCKMWDHTFSHASGSSLVSCFPRAPRTKKEHTITWSVVDNVSLFLWTAARVNACMLGNASWLDETARWSRLCQAPQLVLWGSCRASTCTIHNHSFWYVTPPMEWPRGDMGNATRFPLRWRNQMRFMVLSGICLMTIRLASHDRL
jgi:hypothetical protein